jgi:hypothetical protein
MFERNAIWFGLLLGLALPFAGYGILLMLSEKLQVLLFPTRQLAEPLFDAATLQVLAICLNLIPLHFYNKHYFIKTMRGILIATMAYALLWLIGSGPGLFEGK